jgi:O-antigen/teichoic acid export membrane protein
MAVTRKILIDKLLYYIKNGLAFYWCTFVLLVLIELILGGKLSKILTKENYSLYVNVLNTLPFYNVLINIGMSYGIAYIVAYDPRMKFQIFRQSIQLQTIWYLIIISFHIAAFFIFNNALVATLLISSLIAYPYAYKLNINSLFLATRSYNKAAISITLQKVALLLIFIVIYHISAMQRTLNNRFMIIYPAIEIGVGALYLIVFWRTNLLAFSAKKINYKKRLLGYGKYATFNNGLNLLNFAIITFMLRSSRTSMNDQTMFLLCIVFLSYTSVAITPVFAIMTPLFTVIKNKTPAVREMYKKYFLFTLGFSFLGFFFCRFFFSYIIIGFYARSYWDLPSYFDIFTYLLPVYFLIIYNASVMAAIGKIKYSFSIEVLSTLILVSFFVYGSLFPITDHHTFYYMTCLHLILKVSLQLYSVNKLLNK